MKNLRLPKFGARLATGLLLVLGTACSSGDETQPSGPPAPLPTEFGGDRPVTLRVPDDFDATVARPLLVMLHGYMSSGIVEETYLKLAGTASARGYLYATPDGTFDAGGLRHWNAWPDGDEKGAADDVAYLTKLIEDVRQAYNVDPKRIYITGHSNGGAMTFRMACELASELAAAAPFAGYMPKNSGCKPAQPLHVLEVHGDLDPAVPYAESVDSLGAKGALDLWAKHDGCTTVEAGSPLDLVGDLMGAETTVERRGGCFAGSAELWTMVGAGHVPGFTADFAMNLFDYFDAHPK